MVNKFRSQIGEASSISNISQPKFGKIVFSPHELCRLRIPEGFARKYCRNMLNPVYLEVPGGEVWEVEVEHSEGRIWLAQGWKDFSDYYSISRGHFLMFRYNARSHFNVTIFDFSAAEIEYPTAEIESDDSIDISDVVEHSSESLRHGPLVEERKRKGQEGEAIDISDVVEHSSENLRHGPLVEERKRKGQEGEAIDISDVVEHFSENLSHGPLVQKRKRKRQEEEAEDDIPVNLQSNANVIEEEESQGNVVSLEISEGCEEREQQSNIVTSESEAERDEEIAENYQRAKAFKSKNPFIISFMHPSNVSRPHSLYIPLKFARKYLMQNSGNLVFRVPGRGSWSVKCILLRKDAKVTCGWKAFVLDNKLKYGDVCVLEVINDTKFSLIDVTIFPGVSGSTN